MIENPNVLYTAEATATGGREGRARTSDGRVDVGLDVPTEMGGTGGPGTNPEQLLATGWAACFQSALLRIAAGREVDLSGSSLTARVGIGLGRVAASVSSRHSTWTPLGSAATSPST